MYMPGGPRSPLSPLGPMVPLQCEQRQKNGIWSVGGGTGAFSSMSQIVISGTGGIAGSVPPMIRSLPEPWVMLPLGGRGRPVGGICRGELRGTGDQGGVSSEDSGDALSSEAGQ